MALVLSAAGIQAAAAESPEVALERLLASVQSELSTTEMFLTLFYGVVDRKARVIRFANAGHPHAFLINGRGAVRLKSTAPPLGLANEQPIPGDRVSFEGDDNVLLLFSDGIADAHTGNGDVFGEDRVVQLVRSKLHRPAREIVNAVFAAVAEYSQPAADDQTLLVLKV
jgi:sigma-B regulation protein RsbU (phosphoserine phosphatase)